MNILLKQDWNELRQVIEKKITIRKLDALVFAEIIIKYTKKYNNDNYKDKKIKLDYEDNLKFFDTINVLDYDYNYKWYDFNNLINNYVFKNLNKNSDRFMSILRDSLTEILIYKSNIPALEGPYYYRVYTDLKKEKIIYISDFIGEALDLNLEPTKIMEKVIPAPAYLINKYNIKGCQEFENYIWKN